MPAIDPLSFKKDSIQITLNGPISNFKRFQESCSHHETHIAVDGGANHLNKTNIKPTIIIGDKDSISLRYSLEVPELSYPKDKNFSDFHLALHYASKHYPDREVRVFGGLEGRADHTIANLLTATQFPLKIFFEGPEEVAFLLEKDTNIHTSQMQRLSLIPLEASNNVCSIGLQWELEGEFLSSQYFSLSNRAKKETVSLSYTSGKLFCFLELPSP